MGFNGNIYLVTPLVYDVSEHKPWVSGEMLVMMMMKTCENHIIIMMVGISKM